VKRPSLVCGAADVLGTPVEEGQQSGCCLSHCFHLTLGPVASGRDSTWAFPSGYDETLPLPSPLFQVKLIELRGIFPDDFWSCIRCQ
jgi:hypothetical protein